MSEPPIYGIDKLIEQAVRLYATKGALSASYLQRKLKITPRVARYIMVKLEGRGTKSQ